jgi:hypothetical protein
MKIFWAVTPLQNCTYAEKEKNKEKFKKQRRFFGHFATKYADE